MRLINETKNTILASDIEKLSARKAVVGLIGQKKPRAIFFKTRFGIHTFGVSYPIDVLILDQDDKVAVIKQDMKPREIFFWTPKYDKVIELPEGVLEKTQTKVGDKLGFSDEIPES